MHGESRHDQVEGAGGKVVLEAGHAQVGVREQLSGAVEHRAALVDTDDVGVGMAGGHPLHGHAGAGAEVEEATHGDAHRRLRHRVLEALVAGHLRRDELHVRVGIEVELLAHLHDGMPSYAHGHDDRGGPRLPCQRQLQRP